MKFLPPTQKGDTLWLLLSDPLLCKSLHTKHTSLRWHYRHPLHPCWSIIHKHEVLMDKKHFILKKVFLFRFWSTFRVKSSQRLDFYSKKSFYFNFDQDSVWFHPKEWILLKKVKQHWHHAIKIIQFGVKWSLDPPESALVLALVTKQLLIRQAWMFILIYFIG